MKPDIAQELNTQRLYVCLCYKYVLLPTTHVRFHVHSWTPALHLVNAPTMILQYCQCIVPAFFCA